LLARGGLLIGRGLGDFVVVFVWFLGVLGVWIGPWRAFDSWVFEGLNEFGVE